MKENRNAIYVTTILMTISLLLSGIITYNTKIRNFFMQPDFIVNCLLGIFASSMLALIIASINYSVMKSYELTEYANFINCLNISIIPIYNIFKEEGERNIDHEIEIILSIYEILKENLHMKPSRFYFLLPGKKLENKIDEIVGITCELYKKVLDVKLLIDKYKFKCISLETLDFEVRKLFLYLRDYGDDLLFTNMLTQKHEEYIELAHLQYSHKEKADI